MSETLEALRSALAKREKAVQPCPYNRRRSPKSDDACPKCGADMFEPCRLEVAADSEFVIAARAALQGHANE